jgi:hypothetical protein
MRQSKLRSAGNVPSDAITELGTSIRPFGFQHGQVLLACRIRNGSRAMNSIIYLIGLVVVVLAILSLFGLS